MEAIVEYNYVAQEPDELTLRKGDIIKEIKVMLGGWWEGTLRDKRGMFPDNFVKVLEPASTGTVGSNAGSEGMGSMKTEEVPLRNGGSGRRWCKVLFSYEPCNDDELSLIPQETIEFLGEVEEGWWNGRLNGRVGVFPSNFVSQPVYEEPEKHKEREKRELCRVLFPYEAANEDELTLVEGDIITLLSKDAPDKGWWKGELKGQIGLFPDNFVEVISLKSEPQDQEQWHESSIKSVAKHSHLMKKSEKAHVRKSLDARNIHTDSTKKTISTSSSSSVSTTSLSVGGGSMDRKSAGSHSIISSLKRLVGDAGTNNGNGNTNIALGEELDGVERGEGAPLSHLTASRAKAPGRRPPSSQRLRRHAVGRVPSSATATTVEDNVANGSTETTLEQLRDDEVEGVVVKARKRAPWVEELKLNQLERRKLGLVDRVDKVEVKKERYSRVSPSANVPDSTNTSEADMEETKSKDKDKGPRPDTSPHLEQTATVPSGPAYVPYSVYNQLLERVAALEEKQEVLLHTVGQLSEQLLPLLTNASLNSKD